MNLGEIKAVQSEQPKVVRPDVALNKQLQQDGLKQARELQQSFANANQDISDNRKVAARVLGVSISQSLTIEGRTSDVSAKTDDDEQKAKKPLFDFEEVARNVLNFVGNVIKKAASDGAPDDKLNSLFEQARYGVSKGIKLAEDELGDKATDEVKEGIANSKASIFDGIKDLETSIFDKTEKNTSIVSNSLSIQKAELSEFSVRTRDGDEVQISFGMRENTSTESFSADNGNSQSKFVYQQTTSFSIQVRGELDEGELKAIGDLVAQADDVANMFYRGNIEQAYEKALDIGYDNKELQSFALQLTKVESSQKIQKYGEVQQYSEAPSTDLKAPKAVAEYLNKVLNGMKQANEQLGSQEDFNSIINSLVNEMKDVQVPDILTAINRFHTFNAKLLEGLNIDKPELPTNEKPAE
ncbi:DUF5610 domain-containing protein [Brumicola nitratireducens]|uniref:DUF5610 domain-containing protein n=1 Tax=Glaciecola nitratireducens (strain JCM 12485 / KCTC 12276 / FR1064) TaxID=1085623 RepID=G4QJS9_GLANF|nr:DUF5610 domain-containing protein [Glaciecola nitratireducens]AEP28971.1 hypothetical protein GNIT_0827 [Glaciecola nitratireducens FR1064]